MKHTSLLLAIVALLCSGAAVGAQETPEKEMEFVRNLRERGFVDLAAEYLGELEKRPDPALKAILPLERARTAVALARSQDPSKAAELLSKARTDLETFVDKNKDRPEAAKALLELGRVVAAQGKDLVTMAKRIDGLDFQQEELFKAKPDYQKAVQVLEQAAAKLDDKERPDARLERAITLMQQTELYIKVGDELVNREKALLIEETRKALRGVVDQEKGVPRFVAAAWLVKVYFDQQDPNESLKMYKIVMGLESKDAEPAQRLALLLYLKGPITVDPKYIKFKIPEEKERYKQSLANDWLKTYPPQRNTLEGRGIRNQLANSYVQEGLILFEKNKEKISKEIKKPKTVPKEDPQDLKPPAVTLALYAKAKKLLEELAKGDDEIAEDSRELIPRLDFEGSRSEAKIPIAELPTFEKCYGRGILAMVKAREAARKMAKLTPGDPKDDETRPGLDLERKGHAKEVIKAFRRGLALAGPKDDPKKLDQARLLLVWMYISVGDLHRAAVAGEATSRIQPPSKNAPLAAGYALQAYTTLLARDQQEDRQRIKDLAMFILEDQAKVWKSEPVTPIARYQLAMTYHKEATVYSDDDKVKEAKYKTEKFRAAIAELEKLPETYADFTFAQGQLVFVALEARDKSSDDKEKSFFLDRARAALKRIPKLPEKPDPFTATVYFSAKIKEAELMYAEGAQEINKDKADLAKAGKIFLGMVTFLDQLETQLNKVDKLSKGDKEDKETAKKEDKETAKKDDKTAKKDDKTAKKDDKTAKKDDKTAKKDDKTAKKEMVVDQEEEGGPRLFPKETRKNLDFSLGVVRKYGRLGLADTEYRQGNYDKVFDVQSGLGALIQDVKNRGAGEKPVPMKDYVVTGEILGLAMRAYVQKGQINEAKELLGLLGRLSGEDKIDPDRGRVLGTLVQDLTIQIRDLRKAGDPVKLKKTVDNFTVFLDELAKQLGEKGLDSRHLNFMATCYGSLGRYDRATSLYARIPPPACIKNKKLTADEEKQVQDYWSAQLQHAKFSRLNKDFKTCKKVLDDMLSHPNGRFHLVAEKEQILWLEAQDLWGLSSKKWGGLMQDPRIREWMAKNQNVKALYFEAYFRFSYCLFKYSQTEKVKKAGKEAGFIQQAAQHIYRLETASSSEGWDLVKDDVQEFLTSEKKLRDAYEKLKKDSKKASK